MDEFTQAVKDVEEKCSALLASPRYTLNRLPPCIPQSAVYFFSESGRALYVGRTNKLPNRLRYHTASNHNQATFAFLLAREETGRKKATYKKSGSRRELLNDPVFRSAFDRARERIRAIDIQFIEETEPKRQALLEICAALRAGAKYNDFDNH